MANPSTTLDIRSLIENFATELEAASRRAALEQVLASLGGALAAPAKRGPGRPRGSGAAKPTAAPRTGKRGRRSSEHVEEMATQVHAYVKANPGHRLEEIGRGLKLNTKVLKLPVAKLVAAKALKTAGQKRGTKYFLAGAFKPAKK